MILENLLQIEFAQSMVQNEVSGHKKISKRNLAGDVWMNQIEANIIVWMSYNYVRIG